jgi:hypothetical protein
LGNGWAVRPVVRIVVEASNAKPNRLFMEVLARGLESAANGLCGAQSFICPFLSAN